MTPFQTRVSSATRLLNSAGVLATARAPAAVKASMTLGCYTARATLCCKRLNTSAGTPVGAITPNQ